MCVRSMPCLAGRWDQLAEELLDAAVDVVARSAPPGAAAPLPRGGLVMKRRFGWHRAR
jgi:hypothetical protein